VVERTVKADHACMRSGRTVEERRRLN
jgi:hypothetical protein